MNRQKLDYSQCHTYDCIVVMHNEIINSGVFYIALSNGLYIFIRINGGQIMGMLESFDEDTVCTIY